ncbi:MAG: twin-arginine translocase TatA/TatE family subunit [Gemmatimonadetes bacterium]|uniref:Sec-independent protein translocase protein TatA n=1 Tax=Candidatus Kutchimonas denitrificans TaxID=3056748 RepID=A0AAE4Z6F0_9BACT|nr:twin-arginine translocase TatA/TatE family subunit [Gemmatimonadota bacterium]NIR74209.1 twin-arginine translocase TatA/TatE family subunit [Candidatus Kutchimonas denitrificans]NIR99831.1 twin-arginine translocase TatA/TatE family subunit [Gemmatimonadota bacterium]NIT65420.1 twin-arginine translocase TatA/TatE family subunit [Gemmatimonadota bacterium]NIU51785.1 twin-arginine translocase TatA/TatE family subunit [Gemmatimonadota bacterium]
MGIGNFGWTEGLLIAFLFLLLFGARRLPEIGQSLGKGIREFKKSLTSSDDEPQVGSGSNDPAQVESPRQNEEAR